MTATSTLSRDKQINVFSESEDNVPRGDAAVIDYDAAEFLPDGKQEALAKVERGHWRNLAACLDVLIRRLQGHSITDQTALRSDMSRRAQG